MAISTYNPKEVIGDLATTGVYDAWANSCPLRDTRTKAHSKPDVLGRWLLAIRA